MPTMFRYQFLWVGRLGSAVARLAHDLKLIRAPTYAEACSQYQAKSSFHQQRSEKARRYSQAVTCVRQASGGEGQPPNFPTAIKLCRQNLNCLDELSACREMVRVLNIILRWSTEQRKVDRRTTGTKEGRHVHAM